MPLLDNNKGLDLMHEGKSIRSVLFHALVLQKCVYNRRGIARILRRLVPSSSYSGEDRIEAIRTGRQSSRSVAAVGSGQRKGATSHTGLSAYRLMLRILRRLVHLPHTPESRRARSSLATSREFDKNVHKLVLKAWPNF
jgi:hypothetical protein